MKAVDAQGRILKEGDEIVNFRNERWTFHYVTNRNKIWATTNHGNFTGGMEFYPQVFGLKLFEPEDVASTATVVDGKGVSLELKDAVVKQTKDGHRYVEGFLKAVDLDKIKPEEGAEELLELESMQPYHNILREELIAQAQGGKKEDFSEVEKQMEQFTSTPLHQRYVYRIAAALKYAFGDFDSACINVDKNTISSEEWKKVQDMFFMRHAQMAILYRELFGTEKMRKMFQKAISIAEESAPQGERYGKIVQFLNK